MKKQFEILQKKIELIKEENSEKISELRSQALRLLEKKLEKNSELKKLVSKLENSKDLSQVEHDEFLHIWTRADFSEFIDTENKFQCELFSDYMSENYNTIVDFKNECVSTSIGPAILINHEGDILDQDSRKWVIKKTEYETEEERNELIEKYMEKTGYYPSIISCDYYGNAFFEDIGEK